VGSCVWQEGKRQGKYTIDKRLRCVLRRKYAPETRARWQSAAAHEFAWESSSRGWMGFLVIAVLAAR
jgi:hypothetical protein